MPIPTRSIETRLRDALGEALLTQEPLRHHTTFRVGGPADFYFAAREPDHLVTALRTATELRLPVFLLGGGSNLLVSDEGFRGLVLRNACEAIEFDGTAAHVQCGADFLEFIYQCRDRQLSGLEFAAGIPGSVGGALYGNAGCYGDDIGHYTLECTHVDLTGKLVETKKGEPMEFLSFEDTTDIYETTFFPRAYARFCRLFTNTRPFLLVGKVEEDYSALTLTVEEARYLAGSESPSSVQRAPPEAMS